MDHEETESERIARLIAEAQDAFENPEPVTAGELTDLFSNFKSPEEYRLDEALAEVEDDPSDGESFPSGVDEDVATVDGDDQSGAPGPDAHR